MNSKRVNCYSCDTCGRAIFTVDRAKGVTPMFLTCKATKDCDGMMGSHGYPKGGWFPLTPVKYEWYRPGINDMPKDRSMREHVEQGGLLLRKLPNPVHVEDLPDLENEA